MPSLAPKDRIVADLPRVGLSPRFKMQPAWGFGGNAISAEIVTLAKWPRLPVIHYFQ